MAVIRTVQRFHAALEAGDSGAVRGMLAPGAVVLERGEIERLAGAKLAGQVRIARAMNRTSLQMTARTLGWAAYVYSTARVEARGRPDLINGTEVESAVLSRLGDTWFIEMVHTSFGSGG